MNVAEQSHDKGASWCSLDHVRRLRRATQDAAADHRRGRAHADRAMLHTNATLTLERAGKTNSEAIMSTRYEVPLDRWKPLRNEILQALRSVARRKALISYSDLVAKLTSFPLAADSLALREMLGEISEAEDAAGRGMLSVLVVHKRGDQRPGTGFFKLAADLGRNVEDEDALWTDELKLVYAANAKGR